MFLHRIFKVLMLSSGMLLSIYTCLKDQSITLTVGDTAPSFTANDQNGNLWNSAEHFGKKTIIVYFYPAAMTGGCTKQACGFRNDLLPLKEIDAEVVGISADPVENLKIFEQTYNLNFTLLSDINGYIAESFGVPVYEGGTVHVETDGRNISLNRAFTLARWTYIIDTTGTIVYKNTAVDAGNDSRHVTKFLKKNR